MAIHRGDNYFVNLGPTRGREQAGKRPVLVVSIDAINRLPLVVTVIVGTKSENVPRDYETTVRVSSSDSGLPMETVFLAFQIRSLDPGRFPNKRAGRLAKHAMNRVAEALRYTLGLSPE